MSDKIKEIRKALSKSKLVDKTKKLKPSEKLENEIKKQEKELSLIKNLLTNKEIRDVEISKLSKKTNKVSSLKPLSRESVKTQNLTNFKEKSLITQIADKKDQTNVNDKEDNQWKNNKSNLDDYQFRRTLTKKNEKVELDCDKSIIKEEPHQKTGFIIDNKMNCVIEDLVKSEYNELISFLESIDMMKYFDLFQKNCLDDLATILEIQESHLEEMHINQEDRETVLNKINQLKKEEEEFYQSYQDNTSKELTHNIYEILPEKTNEDELDMDLEQESFRKAIEEFGDRIKSSKGTKRSSDINNDHGNNESSSNTNIQANENENENDKSAISMTTMEAFETSEGGLKYFLPINSKKSCCWICFRLLTNDNRIKSDQIKGKYFCSEKCIEVYFNNNFVKCKTNACQVYLEKIIGVEYCNICSEENELIRKRNEKAKERLIQSTVEIAEINVDSGNEYDPMQDF